uniref:G_PROTEIN_RECEP_F1_2 domain-containing protein n=1 Tax=Caenorhabditis tropicalis TaxID=1561998 RepID=A0A1I7T0J2_9PELO
MKRSSHGFFGFMRSGKKLILATACFALLTQSWSLIFIEEVTMLTDDDQLIGVCERDVDIMSDFGYRILAIGEAFVTYAFPFLLTIVMDIAVLYQSANSRQPPKMPLSCTTSLTRSEYTAV